MCFFGTLCPLARNPSARESLSAFLYELLSGRGPACGEAGDREVKDSFAGLGLIVVVSPSFVLPMPVGFMDRKGRHAGVCKLLITPLVVVKSQKCMFAEGFPWHGELPYGSCDTTRAYVIELVSVFVT